MIPELVVNKKIISSKKFELPVVDSWLQNNDASFDQFDALFSLMKSIRQPLPLFAGHNPLVDNCEGKQTSYKKSKWVGYYQPHVSVAKRASKVPSLCPMPDLIEGCDLPAYSYKTLLCSVVTPNPSLLSERQLRWLDLLKLTPIEIDGESSVTHLFKNEYSLLRRLNVFTSSHPVKLLAFPVENTPSYISRLIKNYDSEFLALPYFNITESHSLTAQYITYLTPNGLSQKDIDNERYKALALNYTDMVKRYERCHQLKGVISALMLSHPEYTDDASKINPFDIRFLYSTAIANNEYEQSKSNTPKKQQEDKILGRRIIEMLYGESGIYEVWLPSSGNPSGTAEYEENNKKSTLTKFFIAGLHSGMLPKDDNIYIDLIKSISTDTCSETNSLLDYNANKHLAFLNDVSIDDKMLLLYLRIMSNNSFFKDKPQLISDLSNSLKPLSVIEQSCLSQKQPI
ncbi:MAG: hypothetical protein J6N72_00090 [Psychrobacter sp.]|nr:hypothetical protein [Psychrobacter sp.]